MRGFVFVFLFLTVQAFSQKNLPFKAGENSMFNISFRGIKVGTAELKIEKQTYLDDISSFHIIGMGKTSLFFDWFFKVRDLYETFLDTLEVRPLKFIRDINEGGFKKNQKYIFKHDEGLVFFNDTSYLIYPNSQDMLSALFYARTFDKDTLYKDQSFFVPIFMDEENYFLEILYIKNEFVNTNFGKINCMVFKPKMQEGRVFEDGEQMKVWISDDKNRLLIKVETQIWAGKIEALIEKCQHIKYPLSIIK